MGAGRAARVPVRPVVSVVVNEQGPVVAVPDRVAEDSVAVVPG